MARLLRRSACGLLLAWTIPLVQAWELPQGFAAYLKENASWRTALREDAAARLSREVGLQAGPTLGFTLTGAGYDDVRGTLATIPTPDLVLLSFPVDAAANLALMLWDPAAGDLAALHELETGRSQAALGEFRRDLYGDYLVSMANYASAAGLVRIRRQTALTYTGLQTAAERRLQLGAGNLKDVLRARVASLQALASADQADHQAQVVRSGWPGALQDQLGPVDDPASAALWLPVFTAAGADLAWLFPGTGAEPPLPDAAQLTVPPAAALASEDWDRRKAAREAEAAGKPLLPSVSWYAGASVNATPDLTGSTTWETILQTGVKLEWTPVSKAASPGTMSLTRLQASDRVAGWDDRNADRTRTLAQLAADYRNKAAVLAQRRQTRQFAEKLNESLRTEMAEGSSTLDLILQGQQLATKAQEDEWTSRWDAAISLLVYLKAAGRLSPPGASP